MIIHIYIGKCSWIFVQIILCIVFLRNYFFFVLRKSFFVIVRTVEVPCTSAAKIPTLFLLLMSVPAEKALRSCFPIILFSLEFQPSTAF